MARFKVKDLMIHVLPSKGEVAKQLEHAGRLCRWPTDLCRWPTDLCRWPTDLCRWPTDWCRWPTDWCRWFTPCILTPDPCGVISPYVAEPGAEVIYPEDLAVLKEQLQQALAKVEERERFLEEKMAPQTLEEVEALEEKLKDALSELEARKGKLRKRGSKG